MNSNQWMVNVNLNKLNLANRSCEDGHFDAAVTLFTQHFCVVIYLFHFFNKSGDFSMISEVRGLCIIFELGDTNNYSVMIEHLYITFYTGSWEYERIIEPFGLMFIHRIYFFVHLMKISFLSDTKGNMQILHMSSKTLYSNESSRRPLTELFLLQKHMNCRFTELFWSYAKMKKKKFDLIYKHI